MRTYKYKLLSAKRNKKLHRQINAGALAWNHCAAFTRRFYRFYGKSVSEPESYILVTRFPGGWCNISHRHGITG